MEGTLQFHEHANDWCHFCGKRVSKLIDVFYPANAEHPHGKEMEYARICFSCVDTMAAMVKKER